MAELNVEPKKKTGWWLWVLIALVALALLYVLKIGRDDGAQNTSSVSADQSITSEHYLKI